MLASGVDNSAGMEKITLVSSVPGLVTGPGAVVSSGPTGGTS